MDSGYFSYWTRKKRKVRTAHSKGHDTHQNDRLLGSSLLLRLGILAKLVDDAVQRFGDKKKKEEEEEKNKKTIRDNLYRATRPRPTMS